MALSGEDKKDVAASFGKKAANAVSKATHDGGGLNTALKNRSAGKGYKPGTTKGDVAKHKRENFRIRYGSSPQTPYRSDYKLFGKGPER